MQQQNIFIALVVNLFQSSVQCTFIKESVLSTLALGRGIQKKFCYFKQLGMAVCVTALLKVL
jgi:hypothetical protein